MPSAQSAAHRSLSIKAEKTKSEMKTTKKGSAIP